MLAASFYCPHCGAANDTQATECFACGHTLSDALLPSSNGASPATSGTLPQVLLRQRYRVLAQVGKGGFGAVYKAADTQLGHRVVAVKEMSQIGLSTQELSEATESFQREAMLLASLKHPNLPRVYDQFIEESRWYLVMEFIEGETLETMLDRRGGCLPLEEALHLAQDLCAALGYLHTRQPPVIFRDLKPSNVMLTPDKQIYLIDFGIARHFKPGQVKDTIAFGSPGYAAPEQYGKAQTTPRADIYGLGALLHQLITGVDPSDAPFRFAPLPPICPAALQTLLQRMVDLAEEKRPESMAQVGQELNRIAGMLASGQWSSSTGALAPVAKSPPTLSPKTKEQWLEDGNDHCTAGRYETALAAFNVALQLDSDYADAYVNKGVTLHALHRYNEAVDAYQRGLQLSPDDASAYQNLGLSLSALKRHEEAIEAYDRAIQVHPTRVKAYTCKGMALSALKRYEDALTTCDLVLQLTPDDADTYAWKGDLFARLKRYEEAMLAYERASRLNPKGERAYEDRWGWRLAKRKTQHAYSASFVRRLTFSYVLDLALLMFLMLFFSGSLPNVTRQPQGPVWLLEGGVLLVLWLFLPQFLRLRPRVRRFTGVALGLISVLFGWLMVGQWLLVLGSRFLPAIAVAVALKCFAPALSLIFSPRELPQRVLALALALSLGVTGALIGSLWCGGSSFTILVAGVIGMAVGFFRMRSVK
jgi:serine/threonine protein kinase